MKEIRKLIRPICNESGLTLVIVMVLSVVALLMMSALIYMVQSGTEISGMQKRYTTAVDAGMGGVDVTRQFIDTQGPPPNLGAINFKLTTEGNACYTAKLTNATGSWPAGCNSSVVLNPADSPNSANASYDMTATLGKYTVYAKIVDTVPGNTAQGAGLVQTGVVASNSGQTPVQAVPYLYTLEVLSQGTDQSLRERSKLTAVYQY